MEVTAVTDAVVAIKSPFQLFSAFTEKDKDKFFGREKETKLLYQRIQEANVVLVYGESGTGKTSIVQCGLLNETKHFNWNSITIRRIDDINDSLLLQLDMAIKDETAKGKQISIAEKMQEVFMRNFQPVLLVFDQFEEIFVYGNEKERLGLLEHIRHISAMSIPWKMVFVIREDFLAQLDEFEKKIPGLFKKRLRVELMNKSNCREVVVKSCEKFEVSLMPLRKNEKGQTDMVYKEAAPDTPDIIINTVCDSRNVIHLPYFQVFLDKLWKEAWTLDPGLIKVNETLVQKVGNMGDVLKAFLEEKVNAQTIISHIDAWKFLKVFVPEKGKGTTRKKVNVNEYTGIKKEDLDKVVDYFVDYKILTFSAINNYELAHESLVPIIQDRPDNGIRPRNLNPTIKGNPYKGLASFNENDNYRFYGRRKAIDEVYEIVKKHDFVAIVGNSGSGKSSLIKAGLFPKLIKIDGYKILTVVKAGDSPIAALNNSYGETQQDTEHKKFVLLIDQYEELNTRISQNQIREDVYNWIRDLLEKQKADRSGVIIKIIVTIRADFEPQFSVKPQLAQYWKLGKYIIPPFTHAEIREVIDEPAYQAGLEFSPPSLVETIADEVYSSQSTGLLPLMSFTLRELYNKYDQRPDADKNNLLLEEDYTELGGVIGGLQNRAQYIFDHFKTVYPGNYHEYQTVMQHLILRMIYLSTGEIAGQRVLKENLVYKDDEINRIKDEILKTLIDSDLIIARANNKEQEYYEPAHDVFIRSWGQIWDWINVAGKDKLSLRSRLAQAVEEYHSNEQKPELLWDNKLTDSLMQEMQSDNTWLNKKEYEFVELSINKRNEDLLRHRLEEEKLQEQEKREQLREERISNQKSKLKTFRIFVAVTLILLAIATSMFFWANKERSNAVEHSMRAEMNYKLAKEAGLKNVSLNKILADTNRLLIAKREELQEKTAFLERQANELKLQTLLAKNAESKARIAESKATTAARQEKQQRIRAEQAITKAVLLSTQLGRAAAELEANSKLKKLYDELVKTAASRDSADSALTIQKIQNTSQLLTISKKLEEEDMVKAYLLAELAYKRDSSNKEAADRFRQISEKPAYYYTKGIDGDYSVFSPDGQKILLYSSLNRTVSLLESNTYRLISALTVNPGLESISFSHDGKYLLLVYKNEVEKRRVNNLNDKNNKDIKEKNIYNASMYGDRLLIQAEDGLHVWQKFLSEEIFTEGASFKPGEKVISAFFSDDGKRVICNCEKGTVYIWNMESKPKKPVVKDVKLTAVSSAGNYFLAGSDTDFSIYNSSGNRIDIPDFKKYGQLNGAVFSEGGGHVLLSFTNSLNPLKSGPRQKGDFFYAEPGYILLGLSTPKKDTVNLSKLIKEDDILVTNDGISNVIIDEDNIIFKKPTGLIKLLKISNRQQEVLAGNSTAVKAISVGDDGNQILTSSIDNATKIWRYSTPGSLAAMKLLPELTAADLKKYGVD